MGADYTFIDPSDLDDPGSFMTFQELFQRPMKYGPHDLADHLVFCGCSCLVEYHHE